MNTDQRILTVGEIRLTPRPKNLKLIARAALLAAALVSLVCIIQHCMSSSTVLEFGFADSTTSKLTAGGGGGRKLLHAVMTPESKKKEMLDELEGAVLEPPTNKASRRTTRYLPDLMGDSLASYPRRVFLDVGLAGRAGSEGWFRQHYPKRDLDFDIIRVDEVGNNGVGKEEQGMTEWLKRNVKDEDYVVMKAEAEVVLEMVKGKTIGLVDELFLECNNQYWHKGKKKSTGERVQKSRRAYWECLALYGKLRDEGIAVHQWWD